MKRYIFDPGLDGDYWEDRCGDWVRYEDYRLAVNNLVLALEEAIEWNWLEDNADENIPTAGLIYMTIDKYKEL